MYKAIVTLLLVIFSIIFFTASLDDWKWIIASIVSSVVLIKIVFSDEKSNKQKTCL